MTPVSPYDPLPVRTLGFAGSLVLAAGGLATGALPQGVGALRPHATVGLISAYLGLALLIAAWWRLGHAAAATPARELLVTLAWWAAPLATGAPLFSRDVYAYLAQGAMVHAGLDVYRQGPADLGGPLAAEVPGVWQHTPTPYGPVFLVCVTTVVALTGTHLLAGVLALRLVALAAVGALAWITARLGERSGFGAGPALWLGVLNPLVLLHLVAGAHNDALMLALLCAGLYAALPTTPAPTGSTAAGAASLPTNARLAIAVLLVTGATLVKVPVAIGLPAVAGLWATQLTGRARLLRALAATGGLAAGGTAAVTALVGTGYGWIGALRTPVSATNWSVSSVLGRLVDALLSTVDGQDSVAVPVFRWLGLAGAGAVTGYVWWHGTRLGPVQWVGLSLGALAILGPATRPWYLLWGVVPLAAAAPPGPLRRMAALASAGLAVVVLPNGYPPGRTDLALAAIGLLLGVLALRVLQPVEPVGARVWAGSGTPW